MPKPGTSYFFLPRRKEGEDPDGPRRHIVVSHEALEGLFHLPLKDAALEIGRCARASHPNLHTTDLSRKGCCALRSSPLNPNFSRANPRLFQPRCARCARHARRAEVAAMFFLPPTPTPNNMPPHPTTPPRRSLPDHLQEGLPPLKFAPVALPEWTPRHRHCGTPHAASRNGRRNNAAPRLHGVVLLPCLGRSGRCASGPVPAGLDGSRHAILRRGQPCWAGVHAQDLRAARRALV